MSLKKQIEEMQAQMLSQVPAETVDTLMSVNKKLFLSHIEDRALKAGDKMPEFQLNNHLGQPVSSAELLGQGPLIINFYRGSWCPYCNLELHALKEKEEDIKNLGAQLIAVSPELPDGTLSSVEKHNLSFQVLSDIDNTVAEKFGLVFTLPEELKEIYLGLGINLEKANGNNTWQLPIPATFIVASDGIITYAFVNPDYTKRLEPEELLEKLKKQLALAIKKQRTYDIRKDVNLLTNILLLISCIISILIPLKHVSADDMHKHSGTMHQMSGKTDAVHQHHSAMEPAGIMGAHTHHAKGWMLTYRYMYMSMDGNRDGTDSLSTGDVHKEFNIAPTEMSMQMHMFGIMYAPTNRLTLMAMLPYLKKEMDHVAKNGTKFTTKTDGIGDIKASAAYQFFQKDIHTFIVNAGLSFPSGSIDERGDTLMPDVQLPYPMQLGSGTVDLLPGLTYIGNSGKWSWGSQLMATVRLGENDNDYSLGDAVGLNGWVARALSDMITTSVRIDGKYWGDIEGADPEIAPTAKIVPTADPDRRSGKRIDLLFGIDISSKEGVLKNGRLAIEGGFPVYQYLDGPQLETDWLITAGLKWTR